jgi:hypothetical protein
VVGVSQWVSEIGMNRQHLAEPMNTTTMAGNCPHWKSEASTARATCYCWVTTDAQYLLGVCAGLGTQIFERERGTAGTASGISVCSSRARCCAQHAYGNN